MLILYPVLTVVLFRCNKREIKAELKSYLFLEQNTCLTFDNLVRKEGIAVKLGITSSYKSLRTHTPCFSLERKSIFVFEEKRRSKETAPKVRDLSLPNNWFSCAQNLPQSNPSSQSDLFLP